MRDHRVQHSGVAHPFVKQAELDRRRALDPQDIARTGAHRRKQFLQQAVCPAGAAISDDVRREARGLDHRQRVARRTAIRVVIDGDGKVSLMPDVTA